MPNHDYFTYEPLPYEWMASIVEKKEDLNILMASKISSNENSKPINMNQINNSISSKTFKKSIFSSQEKKRSKTAFLREKSLNDLSSTKLKNSSNIQLSKRNSCEKLNKNIDQENLIGEHEFFIDNENDISTKLDALLKEEIMNYSKKDLSKKIKERFFSFV